MLTDRKLDSMVMHLEQFKLIDQNRQTDLENLIKGYSQLLGDYKALRNAFDQQKNAFDQQKNVYDQQKGNRTATPKQLISAPAPSSQNPYVLVLIDGNGYIFNDELIREKEEGGMRTARMLNDAVERYLQQCVPDANTSRVIVRIYADLTTVSKQLGKSGVVGMEKRSISSFSAAFTRALPLFDFVDALDEEGTKFKIREQFMLASEDTNCRHILYAACHDHSYLSQLVPFSGLRDKITLVQGAGWNPAFHQFNLNVTQFPTLFRWSGLPGSAPATKAQPTNGAAPAKQKAVQKPAPIPQSTHPSHLQDSWRSPKTNGPSTLFGNNDLSPTESNGSGVMGSIWENMSISNPKESDQICKYFQKNQGSCRYGNKCTFQHVPQHLSGGGGGGSPSEPATPTTSKRFNISSQLPITSIHGRISLNKDNQRIDTYIRPPTTQEWEMYNIRFNKQKPCNSWHLQRSCKAFDCTYDHNELEPESRHVLEYVLRSTPCPKRSACRAADCYHGHICQKDGCTGQMKGCRLKNDLHNVDPKQYTSVPADVEEPEREEEGERNGHGHGFEMEEDGNLMW